MDASQDLARITEQESRLRFERFDAGVAWQLGCALREAVLADGGSVAIDITLNGALLFYAALPGATPENTDWIRRKKNVVGRCHKSSYAVALGYRQNDDSLHKQVGLPLADYATAGGCFPIRMRGSDAVLGTITVSGLPEREDHELVVRCLAEMLDVPVAEVALA